MNKCLLSKISRSNAWEVLKYQCISTMNGEKHPAIEDRGYDPTKQVLRLHHPSDRLMRFWTIDMSEHLES